MPISQTLSNLVKRKTTVIIIIVLFVLAIVFAWHYLFNKPKSFNIENIKSVLDKSNMMVGQTPIQWTVQNDFVEGYLKIDENSYLKYILNDTSIYSETNFTSIGDDLSKIPCLDFAPIFTADEIKKIYQEILHQDIKVNAEKEIQVHDNLYLFYSYKQEKNVVNVICKIFYKVI
jgi:hypothetical protein